MHYRDISRTLGYYLWILLVPLSVPLAFAIYCDWIANTFYPHSAAAFIYTLLITAGLGLVFFLMGRKRKGQFYRREALLMVLIIYLITPAISALPFYFSHTLHNPLDCYFEAVSAMTTTGASVMAPKKYDPSGKEIAYIKTIDAGKPTPYSFYGTITPLRDPHTQNSLEGLDAVSFPIRFWRSFMQWLGGGGVIILFVAVLPALGVGGKILFQSEVSGPAKDSMLPRIKETASLLWKIYLTLTLTEMILLLLFNPNMPFFDALTLSFATLSTGGFISQNSGIAEYNHVATDCILMFFMLAGSINFSLYFFCMRGRFSRINDPELKIFLGIILISSLFAAWQLTGTPSAPLGSEYTEPGKLNFFQALRYGAFQIISMQSSTGFAIQNYEIWPFSIQVLMLILTFIGGMAGSTAGGMKVIRHQAAFRIVLNKIETIYRPDTVRTYRIGNSLIDNRTAIAVLCFILIALFITILGTFLLVLDGVDPETSLTTIACMANNGGCAFRMGGPNETFAFLSPFGKILSCIWMIAGRLEYYALLLVLFPAFWRNT